MKRLTLKYCQDFVKDKGFCLSTEYIDNKVLMKWQCKTCCFIWDARFDNVKKGHWCPKCAGHAKLTIEDCCLTATEKGWTCLSKKYINSKTLMKWKCVCGFIWEARFNDIQQGVGCPQCAGKIKYTIDDCHSFAKSKGWECLSNEYISSKRCIIWKCFCGLIWQASYFSIKRGSGCPSCNKPGKTQKLIFSIVQSIFQDTQIFYDYTKFDWLKNEETKKYQEIDIFVPHLKLAIEYDGQQHFYPVCFGGMSKKSASKIFEHTKYLDAMKNKKVAEHPEDICFFVRFNYKEDITEEYVIRKLKEAGVPISP